MVSLPYVSQIFLCLDYVIIKGLFLYQKIIKHMTRMHKVFLMCTETIATRLAKSWTDHLCLGLTLPNLKKINIAYTSATHATRGYLIETHQILSYKDPCVYIYVILTFDCLFDGV